jgi:hypothetical protein
MREFPKQIVAIYRTVPVLPQRDCKVAYYESPLVFFNHVLWTWQKADDLDEESSSLYSTFRMHGSVPGAQTLKFKDQQVHICFLFLKLGSPFGVRPHVIKMCGLSSAKCDQIVNDEELYRVRQSQRFDTTSKPEESCQGLRMETATLPIFH